MQASTKLEQQKAKLFAQGYSDQWKVSEQSDFDATRQYDRDYCNPYMLPVESDKVQNLSDEFNFFTEQLWREVRRIVDDKV